MNVRLFRSLTLAAGLSLVAGAAMAQTPAVPADVPPSVSLGYSAAPGYAQDYAVRTRPGPTVMGLTGAVEPKYPESTGSITGGRPGVWTGRAR